MQIFSLNCITSYYLLIYSKINLKSRIKCMDTHKKNFEVYCKKYTFVHHKHTNMVSNKFQKKFKYLSSYCTVNIITKLYD